MDLCKARLLSLKTERQHQALYDRTDAGVLIPSGGTSVFTATSSNTYLENKELANSLLDLFRRNGVKLHPTCDIVRLASNAVALSDSLFCDPLATCSDMERFEVLQLRRIASAAMSLDGATVASKYLRDLRNGSLDLFERKQSKAKDTLWELELRELFRSWSMNVEFGEPDLIVQFEDSRVGVSCKKIYSIENLEKVLSRAVKQIAVACDFGIVAMNLDDLVPARQSLHARSTQEMADILASCNFEFLRTHERHFRRYLESGRAICALISTAAFVEIPAESPRYLNARQSFVWTIPGLPAAAAQQVRRFRDAINGTN